MKAAASDFDTPDSIDEAVAVLAQHGASARLIAAAQSFVPAMLARKS
ncbi:MAG: hypothetical protein AAGF49_06390 [Pseudomonadota bacterium]